MMFWIAISISFLYTSVLAHSSHQYETKRAQFDPKVALLGVTPTVPTFENLAVRQNGDILITSVASSQLYQVSKNGSLPPLPIIDIPSFGGLLGIAELQREEFYVIASNLSGAPCSNSVWKVDLRDFIINSNGEIVQPARLSLIKRLCSAGQLNGMTRLAPNDTYNLLLSDSAHGTIYKLDVETGNCQIVLDEPEFKPRTTGINVGVNGVHTHEEYLYFTSLDQGLFARMPISLNTGAAASGVELLATNITFADDFALSSNATKAWIATNGPMEIIVVDIVRKEKSVAAKSALFGSASSVAFDPQGLLYLTGGIKNSNNVTEGSLVRITL